jgi:hypothetical protein
LWSKRFQRFDLEVLFSPCHSLTPQTGLNKRIMARPIKDVQIIWGKDAGRFLKATENPVPISEEKRKK